MEVTEFEAARPRLSAIASRILGSGPDADDVLQEAWLRLSRTDGIDNVPAWLTTVVTRLCLDQLRRRPVALQPAQDARPGFEVPTPEDDAVLGERVSEAMQVVLDALSPAERVALVLHDFFAYSFEEIGQIMGRSSTAVRQLASRARRKVQGLAEPASEQRARAESRAVVDAFLTAARGGDLAGLLQLLAPDAVMRPDLVGQELGSAASYEGADAVAGRFNGARGATPAVIDGELGAAWFQGGAVRVAFVFHVEVGQIREVELIADPEVLAMMQIARSPRS